ncbi:MAG: PEP-CTERM sorting domain-containing protein [Desulfobacteraceae bacterium]|nr:MAG: PEP-CTERM sorting domain-containing protein [Desulfobacteraceae bacterium]
MNRKMNIVVLSLLVLFFAAAPQAQAVLYEGFLTGGGGGITATDGWNDVSTRLSWSVSDVGVQNGNILWQYNYLFEVPTKEISHIIVEVSPEAADNDFTILSGSSAGVQVYGDEGGSNPNIPETMWGIKFEDGSLSLAASFQTTRSPVWGDFYAKDGRDDGIDVTAWNDGFTAGDIDPIDPPANGSVSYHILRPDTQSFQVPEPSTMLLFGISIIGLAGARRRSETA